MATRERRTFRLSFTAPIVLKYAHNREENVWRYSSGLAADVSLEGASILLPERIQAGARIALAVLSPARAGAPDRLEIAKEATVVWVDDRPITQPAFRHGIRFADPDHEVLLRAWPGKRVSE